MIVRQVCFTNFGVYGGEQSFDLVPRSLDQFDRPVVLLWGKNGVGKTTLVEGVRVCLHGRLALGPRVSNREYEAYLLRKLHRKFGLQESNGNPGGDGAPSVVENSEEAAVAMEFDFVDAGEPIRYFVERRWSRTPKGSVDEQLLILENGEAPRDLREKDKETFLRQLISPSTLDLFFFDGERLKALTRDESSSRQLAESVRSLLGLHLVDRLRQDLGLFVDRQLAQELSKEDQERLSELERELVELQTLRDTTLLERQRRLLEDIAHTKEALAHQEEQIAREGGTYAKELDQLRRSQNELERELDLQRRHVQELCSGLMPFSTAPNLCRSVVEQLKGELDRNRQQAVVDAIGGQLSALKVLFESADFWKDTGLKGSPRESDRLIERVNQALYEGAGVGDGDDVQVLHGLSEVQFAVLSTWVSQSLDEVPQTFSDAANQFQETDQTLKEVRKELQRVPEDLILQPLVATLHTLETKLEKQNARNLKLSEEIGSVNYRAEIMEAQVRNLKADIDAERISRGRVGLARQAAQALDEYEERLKRTKLSALETALVRRFNDLSRKTEFVSGVQIDPTTFDVVLSRGDGTFDREEFSEGEKHLFAMATMWALRDTIGMAMPVIIDTPLGRLDSDHRRNIIEKYLPHASHQVVLLATDTEVDATVIEQLAPSVSHVYQMTFDDQLMQTALSVLDVESTLDDMVADGYEA